MSEITVREKAGATWLALEGRIDSMCAPELEAQFDTLIMEGARVLVADFGAVNFVSSAGLRVFLKAQKRLKKVGGEIILCRLAANVLGVFRVSGLSDIFRFFPTQEEVESALLPTQSAPSVTSVDIRGIAVKYIERNPQPGRFMVVGSQEKQAAAQYTEDDVVTVPSTVFQFGAGLATLGEQYREYRNLFGEAVVIDRSFFCYPATKRPVADFMLCPGLESRMEYRFLHGFGFIGEFSHLFSFDRPDGFVTLDQLVDVAGEISDADLLGIVMLAESKGIWGMNLKKVPIAENAPENGKDIFSAENFTEWNNFPVEPSDVNHVVAAVGVAVKDRDTAPLQVQNILPENSRYHVHGAVFSAEPLSREVNRFDAELKRIVTELEVSKVQHILGQSRFATGLAAVFELNS